MVHHQRPEHLGQPGCKLGEVGTGVDQLVEDAKDFSRRAVGHQGEDGGVGIVAHQPQHFTNAGRVEGPLAEGETLVEDREGVAHSAVGVAGDEQQRVGFGLEPFGGEHRAEAGFDGGRADAAEVEPLQP